MDDFWEGGRPALVNRGFFGPSLVRFQLMVRCLSLNDKWRPTPFPWLTGLDLGDSGVWAALT